MKLLPATSLAAPTGWPVSRERGAEAPRSPEQRGPFSQDQYLPPARQSMISSGQTTPITPVQYTWKSVPITADPDRAKENMTTELGRKNPSSKIVSREFNSLGDLHEQWLYVRDLKLNHPEEYKKLWGVMTKERDAAIKSALQGGEQAVTKQAIRDHMFDLSVNLGHEDKDVLDAFRKIHPSERRAVLWELRDAFPDDYEKLRAVCRRTKDKDLKAAIADAQKFD